MTEKGTEQRPTRDGSATLYSARYAQLYASEHGALSEALSVFLAGSGVGARLADGDAGGTVRVLEVGFGTGLNFFVTAAACLQNPAAGLRYTALEHTLLDAPAVRGLAYDSLVGGAVENYLRWRENLSETSGAQVFETGRVRLELRLGEASAQSLPTESFHAVYHDAFSPEVNPELWTEGFLEKLVTALKPGGTLVSYCVQGAVRRRLEALGLEVAKRPGPPGGKREVLAAHKPARKPTRKPQTP